MQLTEKYGLPNGHPFLNLFPPRISNFLFKLGVKLRIIRKYGKFWIKVYDKNGKLKSHSEGYNLIPDIGIKHLGDILVGTETTNLALSYMEPDQGTTEPAIGDTDSETPATPADRLALTLANRASASPFELILETFIDSTTYTRPVTIAKLNVFWGPDESGDLFASGLLATPQELSSAETATMGYAFIWR